MRILNIIVAILAAAVVIAGATFKLTSAGRFDEPELVCSVDGNIEVPVSATDSDLIQYVTATDKQDGDISDKIVVTRKNYFIGGSTFIVTFSVSDSDNNVAMLAKYVTYSDYIPPRIALTRSFIFPVGGLSYDYDITNFVKAYDKIDGDISNNVKLISADFVNTRGQYSINMKVSNSMGDCTDITINAIVSDIYYSDVQINLNYYITYTPVGTAPDYPSYIKSVFNKEKTNYKTDDIVIDSSAVDLETPGVYDVFYRITSGTGDKAQEVALSRLVVVVEGSRS